MVVTKRCARGTCKNDTRYPDSMIKNRNGDPVTFFHSPGQKRQTGKTGIDGYWLVVGATHSIVQRIAAFVAFIL